MTWQSAWITRSAQPSFAELHVDASLNRKDLLEKAGRAVLPMVKVQGYVAGDQDPKRSFHAASLHFLLLQVASAPRARRLRLWPRGRSLRQSFCHSMRTGGVGVLAARSLADLFLFKLAEGWTRESSRPLWSWRKSCSRAMSIWGPWPAKRSFQSSRTNLSTMEWTRFSKLPDGSFQKSEPLV